MDSKRLKEDDDLWAQVNKGLENWKLAEKKLKDGDNQCALVLIKMAKEEIEIALEVSKGKAEKTEFEVSMYYNRIRQVERQFSKKLNGESCFQSTGPTFTSNNQIEGVRRADILRANYSRTSKQSTLEYLAAEIVLQQYVEKLLNTTNLSTASLDSFHGYPHIKSEVIKSVVEPLLRQDGENRVSSVLLFGPKRTGKSFFLSALSGALGFKVLPMKGSDIVERHAAVGPSRFNIAFNRAMDYGATILFLDEFDIFIAEHRRDPQDPYCTMITEMTSQMIRLAEFNIKNRQNPVLLVAATSSPQNVPTEIWYRFDKFIHLTLPNASERSNFLNKTLPDFVSSMSEENYCSLIQETQSFTMGDLKALTDEVFPSLALVEPKIQFNKEDLTIRVRNFREKNRIEVDVDALQNCMIFENTLLGSMKVNLIRESRN